MERKVIGNFSKSWKLIRSIARIRKNILSRLSTNEPYKHTFILDIAVLSCDLGDDKLFTPGQRLLGKFMLKQNSYPSKVYLEEVSDVQRLDLRHFFLLELLPE